MSWKDRIGMAVLAAGMATFFVLIAFDLVSWAGIVAKVWAGIGAIICLIISILYALGKAGEQPEESP